MIAGKNDILQEVSSRITEKTTVLFMRNIHNKTPLHIALENKNYLAIEMFLKILKH